MTTEKSLTVYKQVVPGNQGTSPRWFPTVPKWFRATLTTGSRWFPRSTSFSRAIQKEPRARTPLRGGPSGTALPPSGRGGFPGTKNQKPTPVLTALSHQADQFDHNYWAFVDAGKDTTWKPPLESAADTALRSGIIPTDPTMRQELEHHRMVTAKGGAPDGL